MVTIGRIRDGRIVGWAAFVVVAVLIIPMTAYFFGGSPLGPSGGAASVAGETTVTPVSFGKPYEVVGEVTLPVSDVGVAMLPDVPGPAGPLSLMTIVPAPNDGAWFVDMPGSTLPRARVHRVGPGGRILSTFEVPAGVALATAGSGDDIWLGFAALESATSEVVRRYDSAGRLLGEFTLPEGAFARSLQVDGDGECWAQLEEYAVRDAEKASEYRSVLVPLTDEGGTVQASDQAEAIVDGSFFGEDGLRYVIDSDLIPYAGEFAFPASRVVSYEGSNTVATVEVPKGWRPFAADSAGRVYCEPFPPESPSDSVAYELIGERAAFTSEVRVFGPDGVWTRVALQLPRYTNDFAPVARVSGETLAVTRWDNAGVSMLRLAPAVDRVSTPDVGAGTDAAQALGGTPDLTLVAGPHAPLSGDPYRARDDAERDVMQLLHAGLVRRTSAGDVVPDLAQRVPTVDNGGVSPDGLTVRYDLAPDRTWHDGTAVTAEDVVATWEYLNANAAIPANGFPGLERIAAVEGSGTEVVVTLREPYGPGPETFFPYVLPRALLEKPGSAVNGSLWFEPVGAGPYRLLGWSEERGWRLEAVAQSTPIQRIDVRFEAAEDALAAFQSSPGPAVWLRVPDRLTLDVERDAVGEILRVPTGYWRGLVLDTSDPVLADPAVRRAIMLALPRDAWTVIHGDAAEARVSVFGRGEGIDLPGPVAPDLEAARRVLESAGWRDTDGDGVRERGGRVLEVGFALSIRDGRDEVSFEELEPLEEAWREIGIKPGRQFGAPFHYAPWYLNGYLSTGRHQVGIGVFAVPDDPGIASPFDSADTASGANEWGSDLIRSDDLLLADLHERARSESSAAMRARLAALVERKAYELDTFAPIAPEPRSLAVLGMIEGFDPGPYPAGTLWNVAAWSLEQRP